ncbi:hypothetical protein LMIY3S_00786 [Labrys miyagiensis]
MFDSADTEYGVLPFVRNIAGELVALRPVDASNWASVQYRAESAVMAGRYDGAIAFSRSRDRRSGGIRTAIIAQFGELPDTLAVPAAETAH